jgi:multicomponent Na+:H+ antiporter subunit A
MILAVLSGFVLAILAPALHRARGRSASWILALLPLGLTALFAGLTAVIGPGDALRESLPWVPGLGLQLSFCLDGLGLVFALLIVGIGTLVAVYAGGYLRGHPHLGRFQCYLLLFMASMLGLVLADNVIVLFVFWELTGVASYLLIGFDHAEEKARKAALQALLVTGLGGLALLAGLLLLARVGGSLELSALAAQGDVVRGDPLYPPILILVLAGAFTKSAQAPFHFWLPNAMAAPTPASAYLHSATMVKAGIYLLARLHPVLGDTGAWHYSLTLAGSITMLLGAVLALRQTDLKLLLAHSTVSSLGTLTLLIGLGTVLAAKAAVVFLVVHALYKGALFLVAGAVDHESRTRDVDRLGGLRAAMPITAAAAALAGLSMAGLPPLLGFVAKELVYEAKVQAPRASVLITGAGMLANALIVAVAGVVAFRPFFGPRRETPRSAHEAPPSLWLGPAILALLGTLLGLAPETAAAVMAPAVSAVRAEVTEVKLALWHGLSPVLGLSLATLLAGVGIYHGRGVLRRQGRIFAGLARAGPDRGYDAALEALLALARAQTRLLQSGYLRVYLLIVVAATVALAGGALLGGGAPPLAGIEGARLHEVLLGVLILAAAGVAVRSDSRLAAVAALGVVGYGVALVYAFFGAPDLAMTQIMVDTLTVILFVLVCYHLPRFAALSSRGARVRDALVSLAAGGFVTLLVLVAAGARSEPAASAYYARNSLPRAHGRNVVNVILVDFRALDTLGEITVLAVAGVGVYALLKLRAERPA